MFINRKEKFSIRKFKDGRSDSVKIGTVALLVGAALAMCQDKARLQQQR